MKLSQHLLTEISQITRDIEDNYPELRKYLDETPLTLSDDHHNVETEMDDRALKEYLESLKELMKKYKEDH